MWFPIDQPEYYDDPAHADEVDVVRDAARVVAVEGRRGPAGVRRRLRGGRATSFPPNFGDDLLDKPDAQRQWRWDQQHGMWGYIDPTDTKSWLRHLDYYVKLHQLADESLGTVLGALEEAGACDDTIIIFTSDHGDMCGSHGLRIKGPFVYEEIMHVPCYVSAPGITTPGSQSGALATHVDLASTICALGGVDPRRNRRCKGVDLSPVLERPATERARPRAVRARHRAHREHQQHALRDPRVLRRADEVRALLRRRWRQAVERVLGEGPRLEALRRRRRVRRPGARVVRPRARIRTRW